jgi:thiamine pyrophosphate-dependent acetolactate synthase large subunit-like protein
MKGIEVIIALKDLINDNDVIVSSNGNISRETFHVLPRPQVYLRGSMGLPVPVGLGLALAKPDKRVIVITGDGNFLMGLGSFITSAFYKLKNLKIIILDNMQYFTTGGQQTVSSAINYKKFLDSFDIEYKQSKKANPDEITNDLTDFLKADSFSVLHLAIQASKENLGNIPWHPEEITEKIVSRLTGKNYSLSKRKSLSRNH